LRVSESNFHEMAARSDLCQNRTTGQLLFPRCLVDAWIEAQRAQPVSGLPAALVWLPGHDIVVTAGASCRP